MQLQRSVQAAAELAATGYQEPHAPTLQLLEQPSELQRLRFRSLRQVGEFACSCPMRSRGVCSCSSSVVSPGQRHT